MPSKKLPKPCKGWVFIHPSGRVEFQYFHMRRWDDHDGDRRIRSRRQWHKTWRPTCQCVRFVAIPEAAMKLSGKELKAYITKGIKS